MLTETLPEEVISQLYKAFMAQHVRYVRSSDGGEDRKSLYGDGDADNGDNTRDTSISDGSEEGGNMTGDFGDLFGNMIKTFVTEPDLDKGFQFSRNVFSHHQLEGICEQLRRQLAVAIVNITDKRRSGTGGLIDVPFISDCVAEKINELGIETDTLTDACRMAKCGDAGLAEQTERMQHRVSKLNSWIEWLRMPAPGASEVGCGNPICCCSRAGPDPVGHFASTASEVHPHAVRSLRKETPIDPVKAADEAMYRRLLEEEAEKQKDSTKKMRGKNQQRNTSELKNPPRKGNSKKHAEEQADSTKAQMPVHTESLTGDGAFSGLPQARDVVNEPEQSITVSRVNDSLLNIVHSSLQARTGARRMTTSAFRALELLGDDEAPEQWHVAKQKRKSNKEKNGSHNTVNTGVSPDINVAGSSRRMQQQPDAARADAAAVQLPHCLASDDVDLRKSAHAFMQLVKQKGRWEHHWLVNALNPVTQQHNAEVRAAYKGLSKAVQQEVWKLLPGSPTKRPLLPSSSVGAQASRSPRPKQPFQGESSVVTNISLSSDAMSTRGAMFTEMLERHGVKFQTALTNALNPSSASHVPTIRAAYKTLSKKESKHIWHILPKHPDGDVSDPVSKVKTEICFPAQPSPINSGASRTASRMGVRPTPWSRAIAGSRPVPGNRPTVHSGASSSQQSAATLGDPIPEEPESVLPNMPYNVPTWASSPIQAQGDDEESKLCAVCMDQPCDAIFVPCNHAVTCISCAILIRGNTQECPYCRAKIQNVLSLK
eukprot:jgi/Ulvmu1/5129/UM021_0146.1